MGTNKMNIFYKVFEIGRTKFGQMIRGIYQFLYWAIFSSIYKEIHISSFISPGAVVRTKKSIRLGRDCLIRKGTSISGQSISLGDNVRLGYGSHIFGGDDIIQIGDNVMIAPNVVIAGGYHGTDRSGVPMVFQDGVSKGPIIIGNDVWLGANSVVLSNITIGDGVVVGAGSVVNKDLPDYAIAAGNPVKIIKYRAEQSN